MRWHLAVRAFLAVAAAMVIVSVYEYSALRGVLLVDAARRQHSLAAAGNHLLGPPPTGTARLRSEKLARILAGPQTAAWVLGANRQALASAVPPSLTGLQPPSWSRRPSLSSPSPGQRPKPDAPWSLVLTPKGSMLVTIDPTGPPRDREFIEQVTPTSVILAPLSEAISFLVVGGFLAILVAVGLVLTFTRPLTDSLGQLTAVAELLAGGAYEQRARRPVQVAEVDRLADSFNLMAANIEMAFQLERRAQETLRQFVDDASHELRTPLMALNGFLELLSNGAITEAATQERAVSAMRTEGERLAGLVADLLTLSRLDRAEPLLLSPVSLADTIEEVAAGARPLIAGHRVSFRIDDPGFIRGDRDQLKRVMWNLLANAIAHTAAEKEVEIAVSRRDETVLLTVTDHGSGIAQENLPQIFTRFWRGNRSRGTGGTGLGLSIVQAVTRAHGGEVSVESVVGQGTRFVLEFPGLS